MVLRLWLVFAQVVTGTLGAIFVLSFLKPEWVPWRQDSVVEIREIPAAPQAPPAYQGFPVSFSHAARKAVVSVVNISATKQVRRRSPLLDDPVLRRFFGERFNIPETQLSLGSGVIVSREGFILTNSHVVEGVTEIQVTLNDGRTIAGRIVGSDPETDLAVVRVSTTGLTPITFGQSENLRVGDIVLAIGDPFSVGQTVTMGIVSAVGREIGSANPFGSFIQTDAAINPGNSGGALVDANGNLVGINSLIYSQSGGYQGIGFAIPVGLARKIMEQIIETGAVTRGWFGVEVANITPELAESLGLPGTRGAIVGGIERGSPADRAGVRLGDVIVAVGSLDVADLTATLNAIADVPPGKTVQVKLLRKNREVSIPVTVGRRKPRPSREE